MNKTYKITLIPLDWYFFGGETTFGENEVSKYFAKSNLFPQETSLLGMLRYELLKANDLLPITSINKKQCDELIGTKSFCYPACDENPQTFGCIHTISPVFLQYDGDILYKPPMSHNYDIGFLQENVGKISFTGRTDHKAIPVIRNFASKHYSADCWLSLSGKSEHLLFPNKESNKPSVFLQKTRIGITKRQEERPTKEEMKDGLFKTTLYKLMPGYSFVFFANIDSEKLEGNRLVNLGAERSVFNMKVESTQLNLDSIKKQIPVDSGQLLFISDAFVDNRVLAYCKFGWTDTTPFRNLIRINTAGKNYASLATSEKSTRFNLIKRGSVLFFDDEQLENIIRIIDNPYLQSYGYNQYVVKNKPQ